VIDVGRPELDEGDVLVRVLEAGVCGTDQELNSGVVGESPADGEFLIIGHENLGIVEEAGKSPDGLRKGDLVVATVRRPCRGLCFACRNGEPDICASTDYFERGIKGMHGYMAEYYAERPENLIRVPLELRKTAVLLEPLSVVEKGVEQAFKIQERHIWNPRKALVAGAGTIGLLAGFILLDMGLEVWTFATRGRDSPKAQIAEAAGAHYVNVKEVSLERISKDYGPFDMVVEATGSSEIAFKAIGMVGNGGVVCLEGLSPKRAAHVICTDCINMDLVMGNKAVFGTVSSNRLHFERGLARMESIERRCPGLLERMITRRVRLDEARDALQHDRDDVKVVVEIGGLRR